MNDNDRDAMEHEETHEEPPAATPSFSMDEVKGMLREAVSEALSQSRPPAPRPQPHVEPTPEGASDEEFSENPRSAIAKEINRALHPLRQEMGAFRQFGLERLGGLTLEVEGNKLPHYAEFKKEIDAEMNAVDPLLRTNPETLKLIHDRVVVRHEAELMQRARDEGIRQARGEAPAPGSRNGRNMPSEPDVPSPEALGLSAEQIEDIDSRGGPDRFAREISNGRFKNWGDWVKSNTAWQTANKFKGRRVIPFRRPEPAKRTA